jgi:hypothetical protein
MEIANYIFHTPLHKMSNPNTTEMFSFITDAFEREALTEAYKAIEQVGAWDFMRQDPGEGGFMFSQDPMLKEIDKVM